jgi:hypothetical protein
MKDYDTTPEVDDTTPQPVDDEPQMLRPCGDRRAPRSRRSTGKCQFGNMSARGIV